MAIQKEIWQDHIEGNLFKNNEFLLASTDAGQYVLQGSVVHIPQAGAVPAVVKNRSLSSPATVLQRTDADITYVLDEYTTDPILIPNAESFELSYSKRESILAEYESSLRETVAENMLISWGPTDTTGTIVRTTGASTAAHLASGTGNRKKLTVNDLKNAQLQLNKQNVPMEGRYALLSADMFQQLTDDMSATQYRDFSAAYDAKDGVLGKLFGFNIMMRGSVVTYNNDASPIINPYGATADAADNDGVLCWQIGAVERALGQIAFFERIGDPTYYGDVYSVSVRMGSRIRRSDAKGIVAIVQAAV
ncbi:MAG: phage capsid protein [Bacteroidota bacterium]